MFAFLRLDRLFRLAILLPLVLVPAGPGSLFAQGLGNCLLCEADDDPGLALGKHKKPEERLQVDVTSSVDFSRATITRRGAGRINLSPAGEPTFYGDLFDLGGMALAGEVRVSGSKNAKLLVSFPERVELTSLDGSVIVVTNFQSDLKRNPKLDHDGQLSFNFGADLLVENGTSGNFRGRIPITIEYR